MKTRIHPFPGSLRLKEIRKEAENRHLQKKDHSPAEKPESHEIKALLHELEVHQIELEIQNDELEKSYQQQTDFLEQYSDLYDFAPVGYLSLSSEGEILQLNFRACSMLQKEKANLVSRQLMLFIDAQDRKRFHRYCQNLPVTPDKHSIEVQLAESATYVEIEGCVTEDTGETRLIMIDRSRARASEAENQRLAAAMEGTDDNIIITDCEGNIVYVNPAFERNTGYTKSETLGKNPKFLKSNQQSPEFYKKMWDTLISGKTWRGAFVNKTKDGRLEEEEATISPIKNPNGQTTHYVAIQRNVMEIRSLQAQIQQAQKMEAVGRLAGGVAHDFNNLLTAMMGYTDLSMDSLPDGHPAGDYLRELKKLMDRSAKITKQLLVFARNKVRTPSNVNLNERVGSSLDFLKRMLGESYNLVWKPGRGDIIISIDPVQLDQILANLCINAKDAYEGSGRIYLESGQIRLDQQSMAEQSDSPPGCYAWISVTDKGCGMDQETKEHIFEPFFTTKDIGKGTGLGLATVYGIAKQNNGFIQVSSEKNLGTTFKIFFPESKTDSAAPTGTGTDPSPRGNGETILVVDDEPSILNTIQHALTSLGYHVLTASGGKEAISIWKQEVATGKMDLVLTDVMMPEMTGMEMAQRMHKIKPDLPVLYMTGHIRGDELEQVMTDHPDRFLNKPFTRDSLAIKLNTVLHS